MSIYILNHGCGCECTGDPCTDKNEVINPHIQSRSLYVSKFKAGFLEFTSASTPPKIYLTAYYSGSGSGAYCNLDTYTQNISGDIKYDRTNNAIIENTAVVFTTSVVSGVTYYSYDYPNIPAYPLGFAELVPIGSPITSNSTGQLYNTITYSYGSGSCDYGSGTEIITLDNEYTTDQLNTEVDMILSGGYSGSWLNASPLASYDIDANETTISKQNFQYQFNLPVLSGYNNYVVTWNINTTDVNSSSTLYGMTYIWDGVATNTGIYDNAIMEIPGTVRLQDISGIAKCL